jgi:alkylhydroperoxidase family enzyme
MEPRLNFSKVAPEATRTMRGLEHFVSQFSGLAISVRALVKTRARQINGLCLLPRHAHIRMRAQPGKPDQRLYALNAWRETPFFTERERAALEWTEAIQWTAVLADPLLSTLQRLFSTIAITVNGSELARRLASARSSS